MSKKLFSKIFVFLLVVGLLFAVAPTRQAQAASEVVYNSIPETLPPNMASLGFQATQTSEFGDYIHLAGTNRELRTISVTMSTWAYQATYPEMTDPTGWDHPITLNIYNVIPGAPNALGTLIGTQTQVFHIPWRPAADPTCATPTAWRAADDICYNGYAFNITFDMSESGITLPDDVIVGVAYNTNTWGYQPIGLPGPYESLNVGIGTDLVASIGTDDSADKVFFNSATAGWYSDGGPGGTFREDYNWTPNGTVAIQITADPPLPVWVDDDFTSTTPGWGVTHFDTIQEGINAVAAGGTVNVAAGAYTENVTINKSLTLMGAGDDVVTVTGVNPTTDAGMLNIAASDVTIDGFKFVGAGYKTVRITQPTSNVTFSNNYVVGAEYTSGGGWILFETNYGTAQTNLTITGNIFENNGSQIGVYINPTHPGLEVTNNTFQGDSTSGPVLGIDQMDGTEVITGNNFTDITSPYALFEGFGTVPIVDIFNDNTWPAGYIASGKSVVPASVVYPSTNDINRTNGWAHVDFVSADAVARTMTINFIQPRAMASCVEYRTNTQTTPTDARPNYNPEILDGMWTFKCLYAVGSTPITITLDNPATYVEFRLSFGAEKDERFYWTPFNFVPEVWVDDNFTSATPGWGVDHFAVIQDGIDAVATNGIVHVAAGTYAEALILNKPGVTVRSDAGAATTIIDVPDGTLTTGVKVLANMGTVTFDGFTVKDFTEGGIIQGMSAGTGTTFHVLNNVLSPFGGYLRNGIQVSGDGSTVVGNTITSAYLTSDWASTAIGVVDANNVIVSGNTISGVGDYGISAYTWEDATMSNIQILSNTITGIDYPLGVIAYNDGSVSNVDIHLNKVSGYEGAIEAQAYKEPGYEAYWGTSVTDVDATHNWWGSPFGPQAPVYGEPQIIQWCAAADCLTFLPDDDGKVTISGAPFTQTGAIKLYVDGVNYYLPAGTTIRNSSPCFEVYADDIKIYTDYPAAAACVPTNGSDGIWVADDVQNLRVVNLEFDGTDQTTGSGIFFSGDAVGFQVVDNYFHDLDASGVVFTGTPSGSTMDIQGNMFRDLGAAAIVSPAALNAEFNSWGVYAGATLTNVDTEPHTHADFYMVYEGVVPLEKVAVGNTIKYTVYGNLQKISGADFTLKFPTAYLDAATPTNLSAFTSAGPAMFIVDDVAGTIRFQGASFTPITGENLPIFEVVFTGTAAGTGAISFDQTNDAFAMFPGYGPSTWVYAAGYVDRTVEVFVDSAAPTLTSWTPAEGNIYLAGGEDFVLTVDALDDNLFSLEIDHNVTALPEFTVYASASNVYGSTEAAAQFLAAGVTVTYNETTQTWVLTFDSAGSALTQLLAKKDVEFYAVLHDQAGKTWGSMSPTTPENTFAYSIVFDNTAPALESWAPVKDVTYMLTPSGDFVLTVNALDVNLYGLEIDHSLEGVLPEFWVYADVTDPYGGDGTDFLAAGVEVTYNATTQTWTLTFKDGMPALNAIIANQGITFYAVIHDLAGNQWGSMYTVTPDNTFAYTLYQQQPIARADSTGGDVVAVVTADGNTINFTGEVDWYPADPDLGRTSGHRIGVRLSAPELDFGTSDTTFTFNGQTYDWDLVKDGDDYVLVYPKVTTEHQSWVIMVTWGGGFSQTFTVNFDGTLGPVTAYTVDGEISMQGRVARNTEDVITLDGYMLDDFTADSLDKLGINYTLANVLTGEYTITTHQPRYLNITADLDKSITLISNRTLPALWLRAGNAVWTDNKIDLDDASKVGTDWGKTTNPDGNVNFDSIVNIQDLALVGGNYSLTSMTAYASWLP